MSSYTHTHAGWFYFWRNEYRIPSTAEEMNTWYRPQLKKWIQDTIHSWRNEYRIPSTAEEMNTGYRPQLKKWIHDTVHSWRNEYRIPSTAEEMNTGYRPQLKKWIQDTVHSWRNEYRIPSTAEAHAHTLLLTKPLRLIDAPAAACAVRPTWVRDALHWDCCRHWI